MTTRILTLIAAVLAAPLSGQELPADPGDFADLVAAGTVEAARLFDRGCPAESEWSADALDAVENRAETDMDSRTSLAKAIAARVADCPEADRNRAREWVVKWVDTQHTHGNTWLNASLDSLQATWAIVDALAPFALEHRIQAMARKIACDTRLPFGTRQAANVLLTRDRLEAVLVTVRRPGAPTPLPTPTTLEGGGAKCRGFEPPGS